MALQEQGLGGSWWLQSRDGGAGGACGAGMKGLVALVEQGWRGWLQCGDGDACRAGRGAGGTFRCGNEGAGGAYVAGGTLTFLFCGHFLRLAISRTPHREVYTRREAATLVNTRSEARGPFPVGKHFLAPHCPHSAPPASPLSSLC